MQWVNITSGGQGRVQADLTMGVYPKAHNVKSQLIHIFLQTYKSGKNIFLMKF